MTDRGITGKAPSTWWPKVAIEWVVGTAKALSRMASRIYDLALPTGLQGSGRMAFATHTAGTVTGDLGEARKTSSLQR
jgi:hypothetical protein